MIFKRILNFTLLPTIIVVIILLSTLTIMIINTKTYLNKKSNPTQSIHKITNNASSISTLKIANNINPTITNTTSSNTISNVYNPETSSTSQPQTNTNTNTNTNSNQSYSSLQSGPNYNDPSISSQIY